MRYGRRLLIAVFHPEATRAPRGVGSGSAPGRESLGHPPLRRVLGLIWDAPNGMRGLCPLQNISISMEALEVGEGRPAKEANKHSLVVRRSNIPPAPSFRVECTNP
jgi:hypothetical protein